MVIAGGNGCETGVTVLLRDFDLPGAICGAGQVPPAGQAPHRGYAAGVVTPDRDISEGSVRQVGRHGGVLRRHVIIPAPAAQRPGRLTILPVQDATVMADPGGEFDKGAGRQAGRHHGLFHIPIIFIISYRASPAAQQAGRLRILSVQNAAGVEPFGSDSGECGAGQLRRQDGLLIPVPAPAAQTARRLHILAIQDAAAVKEAGGNGSECKARQVCPDRGVHPSR